MAGGREQSFVGAELRQHENGGEEADDRQQAADLGPCVRERHRAQEHHQHGGGYGDRRLGQPRGRTTANASTARSSATETISAVTVFSGLSLRKRKES